jgi:hypothetical protein
MQDVIDLSLAVREWAESDDPLVRRFRGLSPLEAADFRLADPDQLPFRHRNPRSLAQLQRGLLSCDDTPLVGVVGEFCDHEAVAVPHGRLGPSTPERARPGIQKHLDRIQVVRIVA